MYTLFLAIMIAVGGGSQSAQAQGTPAAAPSSERPKGFRESSATVNGAKIHYMIGGNRRSSFFYMAIRKRSTRGIL